MIAATKNNSQAGESKRNGEPVKRKSILAAKLQAQQANLTYDAARSGTAMDGHWAHADALDGDSANSQFVRAVLSHRSRYEQGSNGYYSGILRTHANMLVGIGPTLRMLTDNRKLNQAIEKDFWAWTQEINLPFKLWQMAHAKTQDGEVFALLQVNPMLRSKVKLDVLPLEAEQCSSLSTYFKDPDQIDGIRFDEFGNVVSYQILPEHPGGMNSFRNIQPVEVAAANVLHWAAPTRPSAHRAIPEMASSLTTGGMSRRHREATVSAAEFAAAYNAFLETQSPPAADEDEDGNSIGGPDPLDAFSQIASEHRSVTALPMGWKASQMRAEHPNAQYKDFHRQQIAELARPISMPYNAAACDSSTYSFASGKLDTLCYRAELDVDRGICDLQVLDKIFAAWFREWTIINALRDSPPAHQWDWPNHPVIDAVAEATATDKKLKNNTISLRQVYSDQGQDFEDQLSIMAEDWFGIANDETIAQARKICVLNNTSQPALPYVAQILGVSLNKDKGSGPPKKDAQNQNDSQANPPEPQPTEEAAAAA